MSIYKSFAVTVIGGNHIKQCKVCQDSSFMYEKNDVSIAVVADGHGDDSNFRSEKGAKIAVACAARGMTEFIKINNPVIPIGKKIPTQDDFDKSIRVLIKHIIASWQENVFEDYTANPFLPEELEKADEKHRIQFKDCNKSSKAYGTTLVAAAITKYYWFGIHIGDGRLTALYPDGSFDQPVPWDEKCYLNITTSICDDNAFERARYYFSFHEVKPPPVAVFLCTDGIDDNYPVEGNEKHLFKLYRTIALTFAEDGFESTCTQLKDLADSFATKGKGDDTSVAGVIDMEVLKQTVPIWQKQVADGE